MLSTQDFRHRQIIFVFTMRGEYIGFRNDNIIVFDKDKKVKFQTSSYLLFALFIVGSTKVTSGVLERARRFGYSIVFLTTNFRVYSIMNAQAEGNTLLRRKQYSYTGFSIGSRIISNKIMNQREALTMIRRKDDKMKEAIGQLEEYSKTVKLLNGSCQEIMGYEGAASKIYFMQMFKDYTWTARRPRVKHDMTNCLLDIGYTMLFNIIDALLAMYGFDTYEGVLHRPFFYRKSLTCDMIEPFRPIIDRSIRKAMNLGRVKEEDFYYRQNQYSLFGKKAVPYIYFLSEGILSYKSEIFLYIQKYYRAFIRDKEMEEFPIFMLGDNQC
ncbi:MAG: type V CRISPR-associated endonuclease Cas1 [Sphaerochaetaceae bacterium]